MSLQTLISRCLGDADPLALARQHGARWSAWLEPLDGQSPAGADPAYDEDFQHMREEIDKLSGADPAHVAVLAEKLLRHTCRDLRVATYYLWARLQSDGEAGLADGLSLLAALLERYPLEVLPLRPGSRKTALEWLAGSKVLDGLAHYPEVVKSEAQRTVAALAWLEQGLQGWPEQQRPDLGALYTALSDRLAQSGGVDAVVPQTSATPEAPAPAGRAPVTVPKSGRDVLDGGRALCTWLREQPDGWLAAHRVMKSLRWDTLHDAPPQDAKGHTRLAAPRGTHLTQLKRLHLQQRWQDLLEQVEQAFAEGVNHFWLDLQWYLCQALGKLPEPQRGWADIVKRDLGMFLERLPGLEHLCWSDGTPFADETTREWITREVAGNQSQNWLSTSSGAAASADDDILALESEALAQADSAGVEAALAWLAQRPGIHNGRQHWLLRLLMARIAEQYGKSDLALHLLAELDAIGERQALAVWEPELHFEIKARLLKLLRARLQRSDTDKPGLNRRMETLLAALVVIDPVRAAVLCN